LKENVNITQREMKSGKIHSNRNARDVSEHDHVEHQ
jgi:hypothetical protein